MLWRLKKEPRVKEGRWLSEAGRGKGIHCFLDPPEGTRLCENLDFILGKYILDHLAQNCKKISYAVFKPPSLWKQQELSCIAASLYLTPGMILMRILRFGLLCSMKYAPEAGRSWVPVQNAPDSNLLYIFFLTIKKGFQIRVGAYVSSLTGYYGILYPTHLIFICFIRDWGIQWHSLPSYYIYPESLLSIFPLELGFGVFFVCLFCSWLILKSWIRNCQNYLFGKKCIFSFSIFTCVCCICITMHVCVCVDEQVHAWVHMYVETQTWC